MRVKALVLMHRIFYKMWWQAYRWGHFTQSRRNAKIWRRVARVVGRWSVDTMTRALELGYADV